MALIEREPLEKFIAAGLNNGEFGHAGVEILGELYVAPEIDPVHAAGGCYCRECEYECVEYCTRPIKDRTNMFYVGSGGFCGWGRRREGGE